jgi:LysR family transcriptional regulator, regulator for genes of the gallate degradation pathway
MNNTTSQQWHMSASIRHLKVFESVGNLRGVRRASEECHLSQPAVTQAIAKLEERVGVPLLTRRASGSYLNEFGIILHRRTQRFFAQIEEALAELGVPGSPLSIPRTASRISWSQIRSLVAVVANGSMPQAARALGVSQTSLQRACRDLERTLGTPLYTQAASGGMATPAAAKFAREVNMAKREIDWAIEEVKTARGNVGGEIVIGAMLLAGSALLASVIQEFVASYPNANIRILNGNTEEMMRCLRMGDVDVVIGLVGDTKCDDLNQIALAETPYLVVGRHGHPLGNKSSVTLDDLAQYDWIIATPGARRRIRFEKLFAGRRAPKTRIETCSLPTVRLLLSRSDRLTILTSYELMYEEDSLEAVPFGPIDPVPSMGLMLRNNCLPTQLLADFIDLVRRRIVGSLLPARELQRIQQKIGVQGPLPPVAAP